MNQRSRNQELTLNKDSSTYEADALFKDPEKGTQARQVGDEATASVSVTAENRIIVVCLPPFECSLML